VQSVASAVAAVIEPANTSRPGERLKLGASDATGPYGRLECRAIRQGVQVADVLVFGMATLPLSLTLSRFTNGSTRRSKQIAES
jgi:hypothetical protein